MAVIVQVSVQIIFFNSDIDFLYPHDLELTICRAIIIVHFTMQYVASGIEGSRLEGLVTKFNQKHICQSKRNLLFIPFSKEKEVITYTLKFIFNLDQSPLKTRFA